MKLSKILHLYPKNTYFFLSKFNVYLVKNKKLKNTDKATYSIAIDEHAEIYQTPTELWLDNNFNDDSAFCFYINTNNNLIYVPNRSFSNTVELVYNKYHVLKNELIFVTDDEEHLEPLSKVKKDFFWHEKMYESFLEMKWNKVNSRLLKSAKKQFKYSIIKIWDTLLPGEVNKKIIYDLTTIKYKIPSITMSFLRSYFIKRFESRPISHDDFCLLVDMYHTKIYYFLETILSSDVIKDLTLEEPEKARPFFNDTFSNCPEMEDFIFHIRDLDHFINESYTKRVSLTDASLEDLEYRIENALSLEDYEKAAHIRDELIKRGVTEYINNDNLDSRLKNSKE